MSISMILEGRLPTLCAWAVMAGLLWLGAAVLYRETRPSFGPETLLLPEAAPRSFAYPFQWPKAPKTAFTLTQRIWLPRFHPTTFLFYPQDFLWAVSVNGREVHAPGLPLSGASCEGRSIDLAPFLHPGINEIGLRMEVRWGEARFRMAVSPWDASRLVLLVISIGATGATMALAVTFFHVRMGRSEAALVLAGMALRIIYLFGTPYFVRSFDYWGHAEYLDYVVQHGRLPPPDANWEAFQPPFYYILVAGATRLMLELGISEGQRYVLWQGISLLLSVALMFAGYSIASTLYGRDRRARLLLLALLAVAPPLVFNAARVSNDSLAALLAFVWLALLLRWWKRPDGVAWMGLSLVLGLALLTKATALALVGVSILCAIMQPRVTLRTKSLLLVVLAVIGIFFAGDYYLCRAEQAKAIDTYVVGNLHSLNSRAHIDHVFSKSLIFNPFKIIRYPFAETWGPRNDYFLEVFFKTMLLGDWIEGAFYKYPARYMMAVALLLIPAFLMGLFQVLRQNRKDDLPLLMVLGGVFAMQWIFLQCAPYLSTQDFRFSVILLVPLLYFWLRGVSFLSPRLKAAAIFLLQLALIDSAIFVVVLAFNG